MASWVAPGWMRTPMPVDEPSRHLASGTSIQVQVSGSAVMGAPGTTPERQSATSPIPLLGGVAGVAGPFGVAPLPPTAPPPAGANEQAAKASAATVKAPTVTTEVVTRMVPSSAAIAGDHRSVTGGQSIQNSQDRPRIVRPTSAGLRCVHEIRARRGRLPPPRRRVNRARVAAAARAARPVADGAPRRLGRARAGARLSGRARSRRRLAHAQLRRSLEPGARARRRPGRGRPGTGASARDPLGQLRRSRARDPGRDARRRPGGADLDRLFAPVARLRPAARGLRAAPARRRVRRRSRALRRRARRRLARSPARRSRRARPRARRCRRPRHHRQDPVHLGLDRRAQGRGQHPAHAHLEPADDRAALAVPRRSRAHPSPSTGCRGATPSAAITTST